MFNSEDPKQLSEHLHIDKDRLYCHCKCGYGTHADEIDSRLVQLFEDIRAKCSEILGHDAPIRVSCGNRCELHNSTLPHHADGSFHLKGMAFDLQPPAGMDYITFARTCRMVSSGRGATIAYEDQACVHVDVRWAA